MSVICVLSILLTIPTLVLDILELTRYRQCWGTPDGDKPCIDLEQEATRLQNAYNFDRSVSPLLRHILNAVCIMCLFVNCDIERR